MGFKPTQPSSGATGGAYTVQAGDSQYYVTCLATVRDFIMLGGVGSSPGTATDAGYYVQWSAIGDATDFPIPATDDARSKQSGIQPFPTQYGFVTAIGGNDFYAYIFQEKGISKATYVGGDVVFNFDLFEEERGCVALGRMTQIDDKYFFQSDRGYHMLENDQIVDLGYGSIDDTYV